MTKKVNVHIKSTVITLFILLVFFALSLVIQSLSSMDSLIPPLFVLAVSHDLRTPLTVIYGSSSMLTENFDAFDDAKKIDIPAENLNRESLSLIMMHARFCLTAKK